MSAVYSFGSKLDTKSQMISQRCNAKVKYAMHTCTDMVSTKHVIPQEGKDTLFHSIGVPERNAAPASNVRKKQSRCLAL
jgi:hypothetical protein